MVVLKRWGYGCPEKVGCGGPERVGYSCPEKVGL